MENLTCKKSLPGALLFIIIAFAAFWTVYPASAQESGKGSIGTPGTPDTETKIHITAQRLVTSQKERFAEFSGNVRVEQENTVINSDRLRIYYKAGADFSSGGSAPGAGNEEMIEKIVATGKVTIDFEDRTATGEEAVYTTSDGFLVLTGKDARIVGEGNYITGEKIVLNRNTGEITVDAGNNRVEAVFESDKKGEGKGPADTGPN